MKPSLLLFFLLVTFSGLHSQNTETTDEAQNVEVKKENIWKTLAKITYRKEYDEIMGFKVDKPIFSKHILALEGKEIEVKGYIIPVEGYKSHKEFIFSAFPYNMCFFCGGAGPETVMEVESMDAIKFQAESIRLRGILRLNADDINNLMFKIVDAQLVESK